MKYVCGISSDGNVIIQDGKGRAVVLTAAEVLSLRDWIDANRAEFTRLINGLDREPKSFLEETRPDEHTRFKRNY